MRTIQQIAAFGIALLALWPGASHCSSFKQQTSFSLDEENINIASTTLVDVLSQDADFSYFIRMLQRARMIPTLNGLKNATLFAPTNDAVLRRNNGSAPQDDISWLLLEEAFSQEDFPSPANDNLQYRLRERLFYHILNYTLPNHTRAADGDYSETRLETTLLFPTTHEEHGRPGHVPYPAPEDTLLGGEGQKLSTRIQEGSLRIGVDEAGENGANIVSEKGGLARNGRVIAIDQVLDPPKSLAHQLRARQKPNDDGSSLSKFANLLTEGIWKNLTGDSHITLFAPQDKAFDVLDPLEWRYLVSGFAEGDIIEIASNHQSKLGESERQKVGYIDRLVKKGSIPLLSGDTAKVTSDSSIVSINDSQVVQSNILASNGVLHIVDSLLLPYGSLALTPEKILLALNATRFVSLFRDNDLSHLLQSSPHNPDNNASYTILATKDDVLDRLERLPWMSLPPVGSKELKEALQYHILDGKWKKSSLKDGKLLSTMLRTPDLGDQQQKIIVSVSSDADGEDSLASTKGVPPLDSDVELAFGNANVIAEPVYVGNSVIYLISKVLEPPPPVVSVALDQGLSTFVASMYASALDSFFQRSPATTFLAASNKAFDYLGLTMNYFLLPSSRDELGQLLKYHAIKGIVYLRDLSFDAEHFETLEGSDIHLEKINGTSEVRVRGPKIGGFPANGDTKTSNVTEGDVLTSSGVLHIVDQVELPPTLSITSEKLMRGAKASTFPDLMRQANLSWIMEGKPAPPDFENYFPFLNLRKADRKKINKRLFDHESYTVLCPTDKAFTRVNLTRYLSDPPSLLALVQLHIIPSPPPSKSSLADPLKFPSNGNPLALSDDATFATLYSKSEGGPSKYGDVAFRQAGESDWLVGIKGARFTNGKHDNARILNFGRNTPRFSQGEGADINDAVQHLNSQSAKPKMTFGGGVLLIDAVLEPYYPGWMQRWGYVVVIVFLVVLGTACVGLLIWKLWERRKIHSAHYEALRQDNEED